ncbi:SRPBCC domain-containing protein, partial [Staphylococcus aureus]|uniref:SRPBCC domain-containing protein n=1 Tax=Staphylococcus aureus TaxID=1280 RepID=UPI003D204FEC
MRFTWHPAEDTPTTIVEVDLSAEESGTRLEITHQHIPTYFDTAALARRWEQALDRLTAATACGSPLAACRPASLAGRRVGGGAVHDRARLVGAGRQAGHRSGQGVLGCEPAHLVERDPHRGQRRG